MDGGDSRRVFQTSHGKERDQDGRPTINVNVPVFTNRRPCVIAVYDSHNYVLDGIANVFGFYGESHDLYFVVKNNYGSGSDFFKLFKIETDRHSNLRQRSRGIVESKKQFNGPDDYGALVYRDDRGHPPFNAERIYRNKQNIVLFFKESDKGEEQPTVSAINVPFQDGMEVILVDGGFYDNPFYFISWFHVPYGSGNATYFDDVVAEDVSGIDRRIRK